MMTDEFKYLIHLLSAAATGNNACKPDKPPDWHRLIKIAEKQNILPLIGFAVNHFAGLGCPADLCGRVTADLKILAVRNYIRRYRVSELLGDMEKAGIHYVLIKGYAVADYYFAPECRVSADTDILINPADEHRACSFLAGRGFAIRGRGKNGHHSVCIHPDMGMIELHVRLFDKIVEDVWFDKVNRYQLIQEPFIRLRIDMVYCRTLGHTDHMIYLAMHMAKHFITSGLSLSMIMDIAVYFKTNQRLIDTGRFWRTLSRLKYSGLINCILTAAITYMHFETDDFPGICTYDERAVDMLMTDLEVGGWLGKNDKRAREDGWHEYNRRKLLKGQKSSYYNYYMCRWMLGEFCYEFFPSRQQLIKRYPYLQHKPWLFPSAWVHRVFIRGLTGLFRGDASRRFVTGEEGLSKAGRDRIQMFQMLKMM